MAKMDVTADFIDNTKSFDRNIRKNMQEAMTDVVFDLKRVASSSAPHKEGHLEKSAQHNVIVGAKAVEGTVGFSAFNNGFNYARWTHDANYNLGKKSKKKKGGKSAYGGGTVPVGAGYLENSVSNNSQGYLKHLEEAYGRSLK